MSESVNAGCVISELVALIERRVCRAQECGHLGQVCNGCCAYICASHGEKCVDCGGLYCEECANFHTVYCKHSVGEMADGGEDPIHDFRREASRTQGRLSEQSFPAKGNAQST